MKQYLEDALHCGEVIWQRGLLKKGYGLCHGAAGNAYGFLALFNITQDPKHLFRACMVRVLVLNYSSHYRKRSCNDLLSQKLILLFKHKQTFVI